MKNLFIALALFAGIVATESAQAGGQREAAAASASAYGHGIYFNEWGSYYTCAPGLRPLSFRRRGYYTTWSYEWTGYGYQLVPTRWWIPRRGIYCLPSQVD